MPLRDLSHRTSDESRGWQGITSAWACSLLSILNLEVLSEEFSADLDVNRPDFFVPWTDRTPDHVVSTDADTGFPPRPTATTAAGFIEPRATHLLVRKEPSRQVVACVAFAQPGYLKSEAGRRSFTVMCARRLQRGESVIAVNGWKPCDLHGELAELLRLPDPIDWKSATGLSAVVYRVIRVKEQTRLDVWTHELAVGRPLPVVPLWLDDERVVPLDLERGFEEMCRSLRIR